MSWEILTEESLPKVIPYLKGALNRGLLYYNYNPIDNFAYRYKQSIFKIEDNILYYGCHSQIMGTRFFKLYYPPIHLRGDEELEKYAISSCIREGLSCWIEENHSLDLKIKTKNAPEFKGTRQAMYHREYDLKGKRYKNIRHEYNRFSSLLEENKITTVLNYPLEKLNHLNQTWLNQTNRKRNVFSYILKNPHKMKPYLKNLTILKEGLPITSALYFSACDEIWHCVSAISDFDQSMSGLQRQCFLHTFKVCDQLNTILIGGYRDKGGKLSKLSLPHSLFNLKHHTAPKMTPEVWNSFKTSQYWFGV
jgi:hypothetical protein